MHVFVNSLHFVNIPSFTNADVIGFVLDLSFNPPTLLYRLAGWIIKSCTIYAFSMAPSSSLVKVSMQRHRTNVAI